MSDETSNALAAPPAWGGKDRQAPLPRVPARDAPPVKTRQTGKAPRINPATMASGAPRQTGLGPRQNDGARSPVYSQPLRKPGLAERQPAPAPMRGSSDRQSGLEFAMGKLADELHPRQKRRR